MTLRQWWGGGVWWRRALRLFWACCAGFPGSGKTALAGRLAGGIPGVCLCPDGWMAAFGIGLFGEGTRGRLEGRLRGRAQELLRLGRAVVLGFGFWARSGRDEKRAGGACARRSG
ncbi:MULTISPECIES: AAA family ATPase [unclassified Streptomyces]|uniref:AAA family ATPase n=1 Tax=unclassified Streptomyces TaxID=2593676 RepID=UPI00338D7804